MSLRLDSRLRCAQYATAALFLHKHHGAQVLSFPILVEFDGRLSGKCGILAWIGGANFLERADHGAMMYIDAGILAGFDRGMQVSLGNGQVDLRWSGIAGVGKFGHSNLELGFVRLLRGGIADGNFRVWLRSGFLDGLMRFPFAAS